MPFAVRLAGLVCIAAAVSSCATIREKVAPQHPTAFVQSPVVLEFIPADFLSVVHFAQGSHADLYSPSSYALWSGPEIAELRRRQSQAAGQTIDPALQSAADKIHDSFLIFECMLVSAFADMSIGYDAVGLRGVSVYLLTPDGRRVDPVQILPGRLREKQVNAIREFNRSNILVFPKKDFAVREDLINNATAIRLVLEKAGSAFYFEWVSSIPPTETCWERKAEYLKAVQVGFCELYGGLVRTMHIFD